MKIHIGFLLILLVPILEAGITEKEIQSPVEGVLVKHVYRNRVKILEVVSPTKNAPAVYVNTTYTVIVDNFPPYKYQTSNSGASFQRLNFGNMKHAVKLHSSSNGVIDKIFVYSSDFRLTFEAFHLKERRLIPFSEKELSKYRILRNE